MFQKLVLLTLLCSIFFSLQCKQQGIIKIGIIHSTTGHMAISETPLVNVYKMAIEEINSNGGIHGKKVVAFIRDGKSDPNIFATEVENLITNENISFIFACWTSACRKKVKPIVEKHNKIMFYPLQYEGMESSPNIIYTGAAPNQQIIPAINWLMKQEKNKFF